MPETHLHVCVGCGAVARSWPEGRRSFSFLRHRQPHIYLHIALVTTHIQTQRTCYLHSTIVATRRTCMCRMRGGTEVMASGEAGGDSSFSSALDSHGDGGDGCGGGEGGPYGDGAGGCEILSTVAHGTGTVGVTSTPGGGEVVAAAAGGSSSGAPPLPDPRRGRLRGLRLPVCGLHSKPMRTHRSHGRVREQ